MEKKPQREYVIPAQPGWAVLVQQTNADGFVESLDEDPVLAWHIVSEGEPEGATVYREPICADGAEMSKGYVLLRPDGRVIEPFQSAWDSKAQYLAWLQEKQRKPRAAA